MYGHRLTKFKFFSSQQQSLIVYVLLTDRYPLFSPSEFWGEVMHYYKRQCPILTNTLKPHDNLVTHNKMNTKVQQHQEIDMTYLSSMTMGFSSLQ